MASALKMRSKKPLPEQRPWWIKISPADSTALRISPEDAHNPRTSRALFAQSARGHSHMQFSFVLLVVISIVEIVVLIAIFVFFSRLRRSEKILNALQASQEQLLQKLHFNAELEHEIMDSFSQRQEELRNLDIRLEDRAAGLRKLLEQAEAVARSPMVLRESILSGYKAGKSIDQLALQSGLSRDEISLILGKLNAL